VERVERRLVKKKEKKERDGGWKILWSAQRYVLSIVRTLVTLTYSRQHPRYVIVKSNLPEFIRCSSKCSALEVN
jgi:hypothetical protein